MGILGEISAPSACSICVHVLYGFALVTAAVCSNKQNNFWLQNDSVRSSLETYTELVEQGSALVRSADQPCHGRGMNHFSAICNHHVFWADSSCLCFTGVSECESSAKLQVSPNTQ